MTETTKGPAITSANVAAAPVTPTPTVLDADIVAKPLTDPDFTNMQASNPAMSLRWVNRIAGNAGRSGRFEQAKASGYRPAKVSDVKNTVPAMMQKDGVIVYGDLILMVIPRVDYVGALKHNDNQARSRVRSATLGTGAKELNKALGEVTGSPEDKAKVRLYTPDV